MIKLCCEYLSGRCIWLYVIITSRTILRVNRHITVCLNVVELFAQGRRQFWSLGDSSKIWTHNHLVSKRTLNHLGKLTIWLSCVVSTYLYGAFDCILLSCNVRVYSQSYFVVCLNVKTLFAQRKRNIWNLSDRNKTRSYQLLVRNRTLTHLAKLAKSLSCVVITYL